MRQIEPQAHVEFPARRVFGHVADGGFLIVSGFLTEEADSITESLSAAGVGRVEISTLGEWGAAVGRPAGRQGPTARKVVD